MAAASRWSMPSSVPLTSWSLPRLPWSRAPQGICAEPAGAWHHGLGDRGRPQLRPAGGNGYCVAMMEEAPPIADILQSKRVTNMHTDP